MTDKGFVRQSTTELHGFTRTQIFRDLVNEIEREGLKVRITETWGQQTFISPDGTTEIEEPTLRGTYVKAWMGDDVYGATVYGEADSYNRFEKEASNGSMRETKKFPQEILDLMAWHKTEEGQAAARRHTATLVVQRLNELEAQAQVLRDYLFEIVDVNDRPIK